MEGFSVQTVILFFTLLNLPAFAATKDSCADHGTNFTEVQKCVDACLAKATDWQIDQIEICNVKHQEKPEDNANCMRGVEKEYSDRRADCRKI